MFDTLKLKIFGRRKIPGTRIDADAEKTAKPSHFYLNSYYSEEIVCRDCGTLFIHTAKDKRSFFEEEKGNIYRRFVRCRACDEIKHPERYPT